jgi:VanZ family protein
VRALKLWLPVALWAGLILSSANDHFSAAESGGLLRSLFGEVPYVLHVILRKLSHVVAYGVLGALVWRADRRWVVVLVVALVVASTDEWMQSRTVNRTGTPWDVLLDVLAAVGVRWLCHRFGSARSAPPAQVKAAAEPPHS